MTVSELAKELGCVMLAGQDGAERTVGGCYCGDLLSWVMGRAQADDVWITVMGNLNAIGVAVLADTACILLSENAALDEEARVRADAQGVPVLQSEQNTFALAVGIAALLLREATME